MKKRVPGELSLIITAIIWGYGFVATSQSLSLYTPYQVIFIRFFISSVILTIAFYKKVINLDKDIIKKGFIVGSFLFLGFVFQTIGLKYTTPSKNAFITSVNVIIVPLISYFIYRRKIKKGEALASVLAILGIFLLTYRSDGSVNFGDFLTFICAIIFALQIFYTSVYMEGKDPIDMTIVQIFTCTIESFVFLLIEGAHVMVPTRGAFLSLLFLGSASTCLATILQMYGQKYVSETLSAVLMSTESLWGTLFSVIVLGELLTPRILLGGLIIFSSIILAQSKIFKE